MLALTDHITQLQAELSTPVSRGERAAIEAELAKAMAEQAVLDREFDRVFEALLGEGR